MNAKLCKKLRQFARSYGAAHPSTDYITMENGSLLIHPLCIRGAYLAQKSAHRH